MSTELTTEAGRKLLAWRPYHDACALNLGTKENPAGQAIEDCDCHLTREVLAIEAKAREQGAAAERERLRSAWEQAKLRRWSEMHDIGHMADAVDGLLSDHQPEDSADASG